MSDFSGLDRHAPRRWNTAPFGEDSWTMFKVISEFVEASR